MILKRFYHFLYFLGDVFLDDLLIDIVVIAELVTAKAQIVIRNVLGRLLCKHDFSQIHIFILVEPHGDLLILGDHFGFAVEHL